MPMKFFRADTGLQITDPHDPSFELKSFMDMDKELIGRLRNVAFKNAKENFSRKEVAINLINSLYSRKN